MGKYDIIRLEVKMKWTIGFLIPFIVGYLGVFLFFRVFGIEFALCFIGGFVAATNFMIYNKEIKN